LRSFVVIYSKATLFCMARTKEFNKEQVLEKAMRVFWAKGFNATSMQDLVDGLGLSRSSIYDTFGDKEGLFYAALETYNNKYQMMSMEDVELATSPLQTLKDRFANLIAISLTDNEHKGCLIVNTTTELAASSAKANYFINQSTSQVIEVLKKLIEKGQQLGEITTRHTAEQLAHYVFNTSVGMQVAARNNSNKQFLLDIAAVTISSIQAQ
jgi:TetR/AcrR family transcriptional regulator, transcriptional repressor for nem operon